MSQADTQGTCLWISLDPERFPSPIETKKRTKGFFPGDERSQGLLSSPLSCVSYSLAATAAQLGTYYNWAFAP